jgi:peptide-N-glycosidase F-like protein/concanavalin A-like lectin/glucanase superfamily protein/type IX secretion system substrate protein
MKKIVLISIAYILISMSAFSNPGDTVVVQAFSFGSPQNAWFVFPSDIVRFEKILMKYTLKCNPAQTPACGEWDYLTYTYLYDHTGLQDSTLITQPVFTMNGTTPSSYGYMNTPSYSYSTHWQYNTVHTDTASLNAYIVGSGSTSSSHPFASAAPVSRTQYLWKASEISAAGMTAGNVTGLRFYLQTLGSLMQNMNINIKASSLDSLTQASFNNSGFTNVYSQNTQFISLGWNSLQFNTSFNWDGISNLLIEITYDNATPATDNMLAATATTFNSGLSNAGSDRVASFHTYGYVNIPINNQLTAIDSFVTVAFRCYGAPAQPMDGTAFEAVDSLGNRLLNSHLPWSDSNVYWDAGYAGTSYDRINKAATTPEIKGKWNYWAFTKNVATGSMKIYLNGVLWHSGTGKIKPMTGIKNFRIGKGNWGGSQTYEGKIDEFAVFGSELSLATIQAYMNKKIDASHPDYADLALYYQCDDGNYSTFADAAPGAHSPATLTSVDNPLRSANEISTNFTQTMLRPNVTFEQGVYTSYLDSTIIIDSVINSPVQIITYTDSVNNPGAPVDTLNVWSAYYNNYVFNAAGVATDSTFVTPDSVMTMVYYQWYKKFPQVKRYELARYITPYGNGLSLGTGWTWTFDVSDYRTLLADSVHLEAGNWQELLDVKFLMIEGTPPRDVVGIQNLWNGGFNFGQPSDPIESHLQALNANIPSNAFNTRWKSRITGHGMDTPENCAEFCAKTHYFKVNGTQQFSKVVWRDNCDVNPLYPQGGTWVYDRANWCPGAEVWTYDWELTPFTTPGTSVNLDHDVQAYVNTGGWDYYQIEDQLVSYGAPNFTLDAAIEDILSPSKDQMYLRYNPVCTSPVIRIKNTGSTTLTSLTITYGMNGAAPSVYNWTGSLAFMEIATVTLGTFNWAMGATDFTVTISNPNGGTDQYVYNNTKVNKYTYPPVMPSQFIVELRTNNYPSEDQYTLKDDAGTVIVSRNGATLSANTTYKDTVTLADGCYTFELTDSGEDGLQFWANTAQGTGYVRFKKVPTPVTLKSFGADFGGQIYYQFTVGLTSGVEDYILTDVNTLNVYPNPSDGNVYIDVNLTAKQDGIIEIIDVLGKRVYLHEFKGLTAESVEADLSELKGGVYFVTLRSGSDLITRKLMIR